MKTRSIMRVSVLTALLALGLSLVAPAYSETILIDLGNEFSWRGVTTPSPDGNGNFWNSVWSGAYYPDLIDIEGNATAIDFGFTLEGGTDSYNGPAGVTSNPPTPAQIAATDIDAVALGNLGINEATMDYCVSSTFEIQGLDPTKTYNLTFFGSHKYNDNDDITVYSVYTDGTYSAVVDSVSLEVGHNELHNRDTVATINDLGPQANNILYIKYVGSNGGNGYLNCIQLEEAPGIKAKIPVPGNGATGVPITTNLTWNKPSDYSPIKYVLRFRASDSPDPNYVIVDPVVDLDLDSDPDTTEAAVPITLDYNTTYDWKVSTYEPNDPAPGVNEGPVWSFTTEPELQVNAGPNIITWLDGGGAVVNLNGSVICQCTPNISWTVDDKPAGSIVYIADETSATTWASFDATGTYFLKLLAQDPPFENEDTIEIQVFADACFAAKANPAGYTPLPHDSNDNCREDLEDFVLFAADWLRDLSLTENLEY